MALASKRSTTSCVNPFLRSWAWKREHRADGDRFDRPYIHKVLVDGTEHSLSINQARFSTRGFASTGITAACIGASSVLLTDLSENLPLLKENVQKNNVSVSVSVAKLEWGCQGDLLDSRTFDIVLAADVMYDASVTPAFLQTLQNLATSSTSILIAYGRNRQAEEDFLKEVSRRGFSIEKIAVEELDDIYQCVDVDVFLMRKKQQVPV